MLSFVKAFIAGLIAMLAFHQGGLWLLDWADVITTRFWDTRPLWETRVPMVAWLALWGGFWGPILWALTRNAEAAGYYVGALLVGAVLLTLVMLGLNVWLPADVFGVDLKVLDYETVGSVLAVNAAYGLGVAILMRVLHPAQWR